MSDLDLDALEKAAKAAQFRRDDGTVADVYGLSNISPSTFLSLIAKAREAEHRTEERDAIERPMTEIAEMLGCDDVDDMPGAVRRVIEEGKDVAQMLVDRERLADEQHAPLTADLATARTQLAMAREALERISYKRSSCRSADHFECAELFGDCLDIAAYALSQLPEASK